MSSPLDTVADHLTDLLVVGGGLSGTAAARTFARAGYRVVLLESRDFGSGISGVSPQLFDGGLSRLASGRVRGVRRALHARRSLVRTAPHLVRPLPMIVAGPVTGWRSPLRRTLTMYELLSRPRHGWPAPRSISVDDTQVLLPGVASAGTQTVPVHYEAMVDTRRLALFAALDARRAGARLLNRCDLVSVESSGGSGARATIRDQLNGDLVQFNVRMILSAAGVGIDPLRRTLGIADSGDLIECRTRRQIFFFSPSDAGAVFEDPRSDARSDSPSGRLRFLLPAPGGMVLECDGEEDLAPLIGRVFAMAPDAPSERSYSWIDKPPPGARRWPGGWILRESIAGIALVHFAASTIAEHQDAARTLLRMLGGELGPPVSSPAKLPPALPGAEFNSVAGEVAAARSRGLAPLQARWIVARYGALWRSVLDGVDDPAQAAGELGVPLLAEVDWEIGQGMTRTLSDLLFRFGAGRIPPDGRGACVDRIARRMARRLGWSGARLERELARWRRESA